MAEPELRELGPGESALAFDAMQALRTHLADAAELARRVDETQRAEGYRLVVIMEPGAGRAAAVAGFRVLHTLAWGRTLYVDDLSTLPEARRRGHATRLLEWLRAEANRLGCDQFHLDSGVGSERAEAHRMYMAKGLRISAHHFSCELRR